MPEKLDDQLLARKIQVVCDGACDAMVRGLESKYVLLY